MNKKILISLVIILICNTVNDNSLYAGNGGNVAAGVIGGLGVGALIGSAARRPHTREVVYVENNVRPSRSSRKERELRQWEQELKQQECDLNTWEKELEEQQRELNKRESALNVKERALNRGKLPTTTIVTTTKELAG